MLVQDAPNSEFEFGSIYHRSAPCNSDGDACLWPSTALGASVSGAASAKSARAISQPRSFQAARLLLGPRLLVSFCEQDLEPHVRVGTTAKRLLVGASIIKKLLVLAAVAFAQVAGSHYHSFWVGDGRLCQR
jgi:hypothetical protein